MIQAADDKIASSMPRGLPTLLDDLLAEQQRLTAVEAFSSWHADHAPAQARYYERLLPATAPSEGEQYAFEVDLDVCSGCKACVTACHNLNDLEPEETWRSVGLLVADRPALPIMQHVTTACHHCVDPGCLSGCPVKAYDKDPHTGIVRHLDDQCIGCQYCVLMCPYEVPQYSKSKGIVRKCDMCRQRLDVGEAPACVQSCPNEAIRITLVRQDDARRRAAEGTFLPHSPLPSITIPTTRFISATPIPETVYPADADYDHPAHGHEPLAIMLVLTQLSVGLIVMERVLSLYGAAGPMFAAALLIGSAVIGGVGGQTAALHLGSPFGAWRAWLGWRTSWLSREIIAFGAYGALGGAVAGWAVLYGTQSAFFGALAWTTAAVGVLGVFCSAKIYIVTQRPFWTAPRTFSRFALTAINLGVSFTLALDATLTWLIGPESTATFVSTRYVLWSAAPLLALLKMAVEGEVFAERHKVSNPFLARTANLMRGRALRRTSRVRFLLGFTSGFLIPFIIFLMFETARDPVPARSLALLALAAFFLRLGGEYLERSLFFRASVAPRMPGALPS